jgi:hypothetical protein
MGLNLPYLQEALRPGNQGLSCRWSISTCRKCRSLGKTGVSGKAIAGLFSHENHRTLCNKLGSPDNNYIGGKRDVRSHCFGSTTAGHRIHLLSPYVSSSFECLRCRNSEVWHVVLNGSIETLRVE